ncbi:MAG: hypothetical protein KatS3mg057_0921 [Herpetosiphonaceae bacterium]|nr:MAG: hypothetical protein KatS3mg057_0921 [Herpetosiphonaceae bacterium]
MSRPIEFFAPPLGVEVVEQSEYQLTLRFNRTQISASQITAQVLNQLEVADFTITEPDLESIIKQIYNGALEVRTLGAEVLP